LYFKHRQAFLPYGGRSPKEGLKGVGVENRKDWGGGVPNLEEQKKKETKLGEMTSENDEKGLRTREEGFHRTHSLKRRRRGIYL